MGRRTKNENESESEPVDKRSSRRKNAKSEKSAKKKEKVLIDVEEVSTDHTNTNYVKTCDITCITDQLKDLFNFQPRNTDPAFHVVGRNTLTSGNFVHFLHSRSIGLTQTAPQNRRSQHPLNDVISDLSLFRVSSPFDRRVTVLAWHPFDPNILVAGSKNGDLIYMNVNDVENLHTIEGIGPGGQLNALKFWPTDPKQVLTAAVDGTVTLYDFQGGEKKVFLDTQQPVRPYSEWYCSADVSFTNRIFVAGDNKGHVKLLTLDGKHVWSQRLHKSKVHHIEFNPCNPWLMATAGLDKTVKLWDIRMIDEEKKSSHLVSLEQASGTTAAYFSLTDGSRLLTTDQNNQLCVYRGPDWRLETSIVHPHRFFQHITPIKAQWHPLADLVTVGRYPDVKCPGSDGTEARTIDVFCGETGKLVTQIYDSSINGIVSLNTYNRAGDMLASAMGQNIVVWRRDHELLEKQNKLLENILENDPDLTKKGVKRKDTNKVTKRDKKMKTSKEDSMDDLKKKLVAKTKVKTKEDKGKKK